MCDSIQSKAACVSHANDAFHKAERERERERIATSRAQRYLINIFVIMSVRPRKKFRLAVLSECTLGNPRLQIFIKNFAPHDLHNLPADVVLFAVDTHTHTTCQYTLSISCILVNTGTLTLINFALRNVFFFFLLHMNSYAGQQSSTFACEVFPF